MTDKEEYGIEDLCICLDAIERRLLEILHAVEKMQVVP